MTGGEEGDSSGDDACRGGEGVFPDRLTGDEPVSLLDAAWGIMNETSAKSSLEPRAGFEGDDADCGSPDPSGRDRVLPAGLSSEEAKCCGPLVVLQSDVMPPVAMLLKTLSKGFGCGRTAGRLLGVRPVRPREGVPMNI